MLSDLYIRLRSLFRRAAVNQELDEELRFHLECQEAKYIRSGMPPEQARRQAQLDFGGRTQAEQECREARGVTFLETLIQDLRFAWRMLLKFPVFTLVIVLTLALGIGANTAIFSLVNAVMLRSLPVQDPQELVVAQWMARVSPGHLGSSSFGDCARQKEGSETKTGCSLSYPFFQELQRQSNFFEDVAAFAGPLQMDLSGVGTATIAQGDLVSGSFFQTLKVKPALGRILEPEDEKPGAQAVTVLSYGYWQRVFGGSANAIGQKVRLNNALFTVVGVADPTFSRLTPGKAIDLWVPLSQAVPLGQRWARANDANSWWLVVIGRLRPGVARTRAEEAASALFVNQAVHGAKPVWTQGDGPRLSLIPAQKGLAGFRNQYGEPLMLLMWTVGIVLLIACANVAGLLLARGAAREREMAVRLAMGAARWRVIRQLLTESLLLSFVGAATGAGLAYAGAKGLTAFFAHNAYIRMDLSLQPDVRVLFFAIAVAFLTGIGFGLAPAFRGARSGITVGLKGSGLTVTTARVNGRFLGLGNGLVVIQVALSMVVLIGAGLLLRTLDNLRRIDPGFDSRNLMLFSINPELAGYSQKQSAVLYSQLRQRLSVLPGVADVSYAMGPLLDGSVWRQDVHIEGQAGKDAVPSRMLSIGPGYFETMKIPVEQGRSLCAADMEKAHPVAVVNREFVRRLVGNRNPIGLHFGGIDPKDTQWEIIGVVANIRYAALREEEGPLAFVPLTSGGTTFVLRTAATPVTLMPAVSNVVKEIDSNLPVVQMKTQSDTIDRLLFNERLLTRLFGLFGLLGLILSSVGLYALLSYEVTRRTREIGIRTALGARRENVMFLILRQGVALIVIGSGLGAGLAFGITRLLETLLYGVRPTDPGTFAIVAILLILTGILACSLPARRAIRVDPMTALRCE